MYDVNIIWKRNVCSSVSDHDVKIAVGTRVEPQQNYNIAQIRGHTNYARSGRQPFPSNSGLCFYHKMAVAITLVNKILSHEWFIVFLT
jgi:hypothetical protein